MISRRSLLRALPALIAAPAIVKASSLMAIKPERYITHIYRIGHFSSQAIDQALVDAMHETMWNGFGVVRFTARDMYGQLLTRAEGAPLSEILKI